MIEITNLVKRYGMKYAVDDISFSVKKGEIVGFLGPNGAGKSTTMNILTGYLSSTSGSAFVGGLDVLENPTEAKKLIGYLPEQPPLYNDMKVGEYLDFVYELKNCKFNKKKHIDEVCSVAKIAEVKDRLIGNLSKGYRQRVGIAQTLIGNPPVIILDEPTVGLDPKQVIEVRNLIRMLGRDHTVILSTHILSEVQAVCDRIIVISDGKIVADEKTENLSRAVNENRRYSVRVCGPQKEVLQAIKSTPGVVSAEAAGERELDSYLYRVESESGIDIRKPLFYMAAEKNFPIIALEAAGVSLEDVFIKITDPDSAKRTQDTRGTRSYRDSRR